MSHPEPLCFAVSGNRMGSRGVDKWMDRQASKEMTQTSTSEFNSLYFGKDLSRNKKKKIASCLEACCAVAALVLWGIFLLPNTFRQSR